MVSVPTKPWKCPCITHLPRYPSRRPPTDSADEASFLVIDLCPLFFSIAVARKRFPEFALVALESARQRARYLESDRRTQEALTRSTARGAMLKKSLRGSVRYAPPRNPEFRVDAVQIVSREVRERDAPAEPHRDLCRTIGSASRTTRTPPCGGTFSGFESPHRARASYRRCARPATESSPLSGHHHVHHGSLAGLTSPSPRCPQCAAAAFRGAGTGPGRPGTSSRCGACARRPAPASTGSRTSLRREC